MIRLIPFRPQIANIELFPILAVNFRLILVRLNSEKSFLHLVAEIFDVDSRLANLEQL